MAEPVVVGATTAIDRGSIGWRAWTDRLPRSMIATLLAAGVAIPLLVGVVAAPPIVNRGEAREAMVVRSVTRGDWILPRREGRVPSKPPLFHWIAALPARAFGVTDVSVRLASALAAWAMLLATIALGVEMAGRRVGWLACGVLLCMPDFWRAALEARVDMMFAACICLSVAGGFRRMTTGAVSGLVQCWLAAAAAVLAKGPAGAILPGLILWTWSRTRADGARPLWSTPLAVGTGAVILGWYGAAYHVGGQAFVDVQLFRENVDRALGLRTFAHRRGHAPLKLAGAFLSHLAPWNVAAAASLSRCVRRRSISSETLFLHCWWIVVLGAFSLAAGQRSIYLLPLHPAIALLCGRLLAARLPQRLLAAASMTLAACAVCVATVTVHRAWADAAIARPLHAFAQHIAPVITAAGGVQATWGVPENDRLVLAWLLDRDVPRIEPPLAIATHVVATLPLPERLSQGCVPVAAPPPPRHAALTLLECSPSATCE